MSDEQWKTPDEVRADLNAAREAFKTRYRLHRAYGVTSNPTAMQDYQLLPASHDDERWEAILDDYIRIYTNMRANDAESRTYGPGYPW